MLTIRSCIIPLHIFFILENPYRPYGTFQPALFSKLLKEKYSLLNKGGQKHAIFACSEIHFFLKADLSTSISMY